MNKPESSSRSSNPPLLDWQKELLDERLEAAEKNPEGWLIWDEVKRLVFSPGQMKS